MESVCDREVGCSASDLPGLNFESCAWRAVSSHSAHHPQEVLSLFSHHNLTSIDVRFFMCRCVGSNIPPVHFRTDGPTSSHAYSERWAHIKTCVFRQEGPHQDMRIQTGGSTSRHACSDRWAHMKTCVFRQVGLHQDMRIQTGGPTSEHAYFKTDGPHQGMRIQTGGPTSKHAYSDRLVHIKTCVFIQVGPHPNMRIYRWANIQTCVFTGGPTSRHAYSQVGPH